jgi:hypothetical protein
LSSPTKISRRLCSPIVSWSRWRGHHRYLLKSEA